MTTLFIIGMWVAVIGGMYLFMNASFWIFAQLFGIVDRYLQQRYWDDYYAKRGYSKITGEDGKEWYVGYGE